MILKNIQLALPRVADPRPVSPSVPEPGMPLPPTVPINPIIVHAPTAPEYLHVRYQCARTPHGVGPLLGGPPERGPTPFGGGGGPGRGDIAVGMWPDPLAAGYSILAQLVAAMPQPAMTRGLARLRSDRMPPSAAAYLGIDPAGIAGPIARSPRRRERIYRAASEADPPLADYAAQAPTDRAAALALVERAEAGDAEAIRHLEALDVRTYVSTAFHDTEAVHLLLRIVHTVHNSSALDGLMAAIEANPAVFDAVCRWYGAQKITTFPQTLVDRLAAMDLAQYVAMAGYNAAALSALDLFAGLGSAAAIEALAHIAESHVPQRGAAVVIFTSLVQSGDERCRDRARRLKVEGAERAIRYELAVYWALQQLAKMDNPDALAIIERLRGSEIEQAGRLAPAVQSALQELAAVVQQPVLAIWRLQDTDMVVRAFHREPDTVMSAVLTLMLAGYQPADAAYKAIQASLERRQGRKRYQHARRLIAEYKSDQWVSFLEHGDNMALLMTQELAMSAPIAAMALAKFYLLQPASYLWSHHWVALRLSWSPFLRM